IPALKQMLQANGIKDEDDDDRGGPDDEYTNGEQYESQKHNPDLMPPRGRQVQPAQDSKGFAKRWGNSTQHIRVIDTRTNYRRLASDAKPNPKAFAQRWGQTMSHIRLSSSGHY